MKHIVHILPSSFPAIKYGGTERAVACLTKAQAENGWRATVLCTKKTNAYDFAQVVDNIDFSHASLNSWIHQNNVDLVHFHTIPSPSFDLNQFPHVVTIHGNGKADEHFPKNSIFVSKNHAQRHNSESFVYNGIEVENYPIRTSTLESSSRLSFLAKASWSIKNLRGAIKIARASKLPLDVMGGKRPFTAQGLLTWKTKFHGMVDDSKKIELFHQSRALLFPVLWHEPFGIAVIEAMATGIPVIATPFGSLPELIDSSSGICTQSIEDMIDFALNRFRKISPEACRARVNNFFSHTKMFASYHDKYNLVWDGKALNEQDPRTLKPAYLDFELK